MSEHEDLWPGPQRARGTDGEPQSPLPPASSASSHPTDPATPDLVPDAVPATGAEPGSVVGQSSDAPAEPAVTPLTDDASDQPPAALGSRSEARSQSTTDRRRSVSRPVLIWSIVGVVVLAAAAAAAYLLLRDDGSTPGAAPAPTVTRTLPAPTPATEPIERGEGTALFTSLPGVARQYVLATIAAGDLAAQAGALETYDLTYTGDLNGAAATYSVQVTQWATPEAAAAAAEALSAGAAPASSAGEVLVGGAATGAFSLFGEDGSAAETGQAVWTNGTVVLHASGPALDIRNFYLAYGL